MCMFYLAVLDTDCTWSMVIQLAWGWYNKALIMFLIHCNVSRKKLLGQNFSVFYLDFVISPPLAYNSSHFLLIHVYNLVIYIHY